MTKKFLTRTELRGGQNSLAINDEQSLAQNMLVMNSEKSYKPLSARSLFDEQSRHLPELEREKLRILIRTESVVHDGNIAGKNEGCM